MELWVKLAAAVATVLALSFIVERVSPRASGILSGYPLGTAIALFFIGWENGAAFAADSAVHTLGGLSASLVMVFVYYRVSRLRADTAASMTAAALGSLAAFFAASLALGTLQLGATGGSALTAAVAVLFSWRFRRIENVKCSGEVALSFRHHLLRAAIAGGTVLLVSGAARASGPGVAGHLAAFPITLFPLLLIVHGAHGYRPVHTIIKHFPVGMGSLLLYTLSVSLSYKPWGLAVGTLTSFAVATAYLGMLALLPVLRTEEESGAGGASSGRNGVAR